LGDYVIQMGSGLQVGDEEKGTLDLILAHPDSRTALYWRRWLALVAATLGILTIVWGGLLVAMRWSTMYIAPGRLWLPLLSLWAVLVLFGALALLLSMLLPSRSLAASVAGLLLVASYFVTSLARINDRLQGMARLSPLNYQQTEEAFRGLNGRWFAGLLAAATVLAVLAWWRFEQRDIRVGGEGGWQAGQFRWLHRTAPR
jgi:ABC-2 type transport system permease protein